MINFGFCWVIGLPTVSTADDCQGPSSITRTLKGFVLGSAGSLAQVSSFDLASAARWQDTESRSTAYETLRGKGVTSGQRSCLQAEA